ncbi:hypothetical protein GCM10027517_33120 [Phycicoccus ginsengisoli]
MPTRTGVRSVLATVAAAALAAFATLAGVSVGGATAAGSRGPSASGVAAVIEAYRTRIPQLMAEQHVPGLAVALVDRDRVLWQQGFGSTDTDGRTPITPDTVFSVQSMSKTFTTTAVLEAVQAGRLDLDAPVTTYLPGFTVHSAFEQHPERRITVRMLLDCTAGFTHDPPLGNNYTATVGTFDAHVRSISDTWLRFPVGTGFAYSNEGFDLAGYLLERVYGTRFPLVMHDLVLAPLGMDHSSFDRATVHAITDRAVGHKPDAVPPRVDSPMTGAGGLWTSAADLARFLRFQLGNGTVDGRTVLDASLVRRMRTVPATAPSTTAGYALGIARTRWQAAQYLDLLTHGGGGEGFLSDLWFAPQVGLGIAVLTNSSDNTLQGSLAMGIMNDLVVAPDSPYAARLRSLPTQAAVLPDGGDFVPPADLGRRIHALALPASAQQTARWAAYPEFYRAGELGAMDPTKPASRFHVEAGVPYFEAGEDGALVRNRLTEVEPGVFLADDGETLDLRAATRTWHGLELHAVTNGPVAWQWALLAVTGLVAMGWLLVAAVGSVGGRRRGAPVSAPAAPGAPGHRGGRRLTGAVAVVGALAALASVAAIVVVPGLVDVGFLGWAAVALPLRLAFHLPLAVALLTVALAALVALGARRGWWGTRVRVRDVVLVAGLAALSVQLGAWHLVAWGF